MTHAYACLILVSRKAVIEVSAGWDEIAMDRDRRGRRRRPNQERGLRPLHPLLPQEWTSKALRVAMSRRDWARFEALVGSVALEAPTQARANGIVISRLIESATSPQTSSEPLDWMDWERQKTLRLLRSAV